MGTVRKRGATYRAEVFRRGTRDSATFETRQEAIDWIVAREAELLVGKGPRGSRTLVDAIDEHLKRAPRGRSERARLAEIKTKAWAQKPLRDLTAADLASWRDERAKVVKPATVRREMTMVRGVLEAARRELGWISENPIQDVRRPSKVPPRQRLISDDERDAMVEALGFDGTRVETIRHEVAVALLFALETAMRAGEILSLRPGDIDRAARIARLHKSKTGPGRDVPLSTRALELLDIMSRKQLLHTRSASDGRIWHSDGDVLDATFRRARNAAGLGDFVFHDSRATALTRLAKILSPYDLARMAGHSSLAMVMVYYREPASSIAERLG